MLYNAIIHVNIPLNLHVHHQRINKPLPIKNSFFFSISSLTFFYQKSYPFALFLISSSSFILNILYKKSSKSFFHFQILSTSHIPYFPLFTSSMIPKFAIHKVYLFFLLHLLDYNREQSSQIHSKTKSVRTTQRRTYYHPISQCISLYSFPLIQ